LLKHGERKKNSSTNFSLSTILIHLWNLSTQASLRSDFLPGNWQNESNKHSGSISKTKQNKTIRALLSLCETFLKLIVAFFPFLIVTVKKKKKKEKRKKKKRKLQLIIFNNNNNNPLSSDSIFISVRTEQIYESTWEPYWRGSAGETIREQDRRSFQRRVPTSSQIKEQRGRAVKVCKQRAYAQATEPKRRPL